MLAVGAWAGEPGLFELPFPYVQNGVSFPYMAVVKVKWDNEGRSCFFQQMVREMVSSNIN